MEKTSIQKNDGAPVLGTYKVPVVWTMTGYLDISAEDGKSAIREALKKAKTCALNDVSEAEYLADSFSVVEDEDAVIPVIDR